MKLKTHVVIKTQKLKIKKTQTSKCNKTQNSNYDETQIMTKLNYSKCDQNQIVTKLKNYNFYKAFLLLWQNLNYDKSLLMRIKKKYEGLLVRTFWHIDNWFDVLWAAFCDSRDVLFKHYVVSQLFTAFGNPISACMIASAEVHFEKCSSKISEEF